MGRRTFSREFKLEAVKLVRDRSVAVAQACRNLDSKRCAEAALLLTGLAAR